MFLLLAPAVTDSVIVLYDSCKVNTVIASSPNSRLRWRVTQHTLCHALATHGSATIRARYMLPPSPFGDDTQPTRAHASRRTRPCPSAYVPHQRGELDGDHAVHVETVFV